MKRISIELSQKAQFKLSNKKIKYYIANHSEHSEVFGVVEEEGDKLEVIMFVCTVIVSTSNLAPEICVMVRDTPRYRIVKERIDEGVKLGVIEFYTSIEDLFDDLTNKRLEKKNRALLSSIN